MANAFARRFQSVVDQLAGGDKKQFAEQTGKSASHIYKICRGASRPSMAYLESLYEEFRVDLNWLLTGEQSSSDQPAGSVSDRDIVFAPMFDVQASAGGGALVQAEDITDYFAFNKSFLSRQLGVSGDHLAFVSVSGESMLPTLNDGDRVLVDMSQRTVQREGIYLLQTDDGLMAKRLKQAANGDLNVNSDNPEYPSWTIPVQDREHNPVLGKVVWCARSI
ncbi:MAG: XRE family transcriptional regulator [Endozoicomonas sp.]